MTAAGKALVTGLAGLDLAPVTVTVGTPVLDPVVVTPKSARRVVVQAKAPGVSRFTVASSGLSSTRGGYTVRFTPTGAGAWVYRVLVEASTIARAYTSPAHTVTATTHPGHPAGDTTAGRAG